MYKLKTCMFYLGHSTLHLVIGSCAISNRGREEALCGNRQYFRGLKGGDKTGVETGTSIVSLAHFLGNYSFSFLFLIWWVAL